jgi:hypothetical protein
VIVASPEPSLAGSHDHAASDRGNVDSVAERADPDHVRAGLWKRHELLELASYNRDLEVVPADCAFVCAD